MKLFISYARVDVGQVTQLVEILRSGGHDPWFDHRLLPGQNWKRELHNAIEHCEAFVYMLTQESIVSEWCQWEFADAVKMGKPIVPILLRKAQIPDSISTFHYADFSGGITPHNVAQLMGGLFVIIANQPRIGIPTAPANPAGFPAQAASPNQSEILVPPDLSGLPEPFEWCEISAGEVTLTDIGGYLNKPETFKVERFWMAKYPITNAQFWLFESAKDGYADPKWWDYSATAQRWRRENPKPEETAFKGDMLPRTKVSWYEAVAFCRWLTNLVSPKGGLTSWEIRLPTEQEWQRAAQGDDGLKYPWGNTFDKSYTNTSESGFKSPTPVTQY
ncbi:MAG: SUMF1/EgtB/PvdO family nonheme iron enzyme, partial [Anaerolineae bacterium]|nr:SUMF1/EgtB/PvdO family nonheme iron enzyme [Anaerolineae bacterium]